MDTEGSFAADMQQELKDERSVLVSAEATVTPFPPYVFMVWCLIILETISH
jgi:hypothetical protein